MKKCRNENIAKGNLRERGIANREGRMNKVGRIDEVSGC